MSPTFRGALRGYKNYPAQTSMSVADPIAIVGGIAAVLALWKGLLEAVKWFRRRARSSLKWELIQLYDLDRQLEAVHQPLRSSAERRLAREPMVGIGRLRGLPEDRRAVGSPQGVLGLRARRLLRFEPQPPRLRPLPLHGAPHRQVVRARRKLALVLRGRDAGIAEGSEPEDRAPRTFGALR
jgi:hypothetical protein